MAGLYNRMVDPNLVAPDLSGHGANAGIGAPGAAALQRPQEDDFNAQQLAGLLGLLAKKKPGDGDTAAPGAAGAEGTGAAPGMTPVGNDGNFDMAPAAAGMIPNGGDFQLPPQGSGEAYALGNVGAQGAPLLSNFGGGIPAASAAPAGIGAAAMPASIGGAGIPPIVGLDPSQLQGILGFLPGVGGAGGFGYGG